MKKSHLILAGVAVVVLATAGAGAYVFLDSDTPPPPMHPTPMTPPPAAAMAPAPTPNPMGAPSAAPAPAAAPMGAPSAPAAIAAPSPAPAPSGNPGAPVTHAEFAGLVRDALVNDPTILTDAIKKLHDKQDEEMNKQAKEGLTKHKDDLYNDANAPVVGPDDADVTIVEFFDYHCGYCKAVLPSITKLLSEDKKLKVIFKEYPILSEDSIYASRAALAVYKLDKSKYFDFHSALFASKTKFDEKSIQDIAKKVGIDGAKLKAEMSKPEYDAMIDKNRDVGGDIGIRGTPALIIAGEMFPGAMPYEDIKKAIAEARKPAAPAPAPVAPAAPAAVAPPAPAASAPAPAPAGAMTPLPNASAPTPPAPPAGDAPKP